jgi:hypothetical protein
LKDESLKERETSDDVAERGKRVQRDFEGEADDVLISITSTNTTPSTKITFVSLVLNLKIRILRFEVVTINAHSSTFITLKGRAWVLGVDEDDLLRRERQSQICVECV